MYSLYSLYSCVRESTPSADFLFEWKSELSLFVILLLDSFNTFCIFLLQHSLWLVRCSDSYPACDTCTSGLAVWGNVTHWITYDHEENEYLLWLRSAIWSIQELLCHFEMFYCVLTRRLFTWHSARLCHTESNVFVYDSDTNSKKILLMCLKSCFVLFLHFLFIINYSLSHIDGVTVHDKHTNTKIRWTGLNKFSQAGKRRVRILTRRSKLKVYTKLTVFQKNIRTTVVKPWQYKHEYNHTFKNNIEDSGEADRVKTWSNVSTDGNSS